MPDLHNQVSTADILNLSDEDFARELGLPVSADAEAKPATEQPEQPRTEDGRFTTKQPEATTEEPDEPEGPEVEDEPEEPEPEPEPEAKPLKLATEFQAYDDQGDYDLGELAKVRIKFKGNGKERDEPLDKVVRLAQYGYYNEAQSRENDELKQYLPSLQAQLEQTQQEAEDLKALQLKMLRDEDFYLQTRERLQATLTPEYRAQQLEQELAEVKRGEQSRNQAIEGTRFAQEAVLPKLNALIEQYPSISQEEVLGIFTAATAPMTRNGVIPKNLWPRVMSIIDGDIGQRMAQLHESRESQTAKAAKVAKTKVTKAQEETTKAKRTLARAIKGPAGATPSSGKAAVKPRVIRDADDAMESVLDDVRASLPV